VNIIVKRCGSCGETKDDSEFQKDKRNKDGLRYRCKDCERAAKKIYYKDNKQVVVAYSKTYYENNKETYLESSRKWRKNNPERTWVNNTLSHHSYRGYIITITKEELEQMLKSTKTCIYCGRELHYSYGDRKTAKSDSPTLDRIDNEQELTKENVQIICKECNTAKGSKPHDVFVEYCYSIGQKFRGK